MLYVRLKFTICEASSALIQIDNVSRPIKRVQELIKFYFLEYYKPISLEKLSGGKAKLFMLTNDSIIAIVDSNRRFKGEAVLKVVNVDCI